MLISRKFIYLLLVSLFIINCSNLFQPILGADDAVLYDNVAKHMVMSNDWIGLFVKNQPWLDKPHFQFWITALSFKIFGISSFSYILPGLLFYFIGVIYTYKLGNLSYNQDVGLLSAVITLSSLHLMYSAGLDLRAEAYLIGLIMPACYYWLRYDSITKVSYLVLGSLFSACAIMTKGLFLLLPIFSGIIITWIYTKAWHKLYSLKWLFALALIAIFVLPEIICLYLQFDSHPELSVHAASNVSGIQWFLYDSQIDRFFNNGVIVRSDGSFFYFIHTFLWAFLPWSFLFIIAVVASIKQFKQQSAIEKAKSIYIWSSFFCSFLIFSLAKFQLDHYINIVFPFAAILCANYISNSFAVRNISYLQMAIGIVLCLIAIIGVIYLLGLTWISTLAIIPILLIFTNISAIRHSYHEQLILFPIIGVSSIFILISIVNLKLVATNDIGYNMANYLNTVSAVRVYDLNYNDSNLELHFKGKYILVNDKNNLPNSLAKDDYVAISDGYYSSNMAYFINNKYVIAQRVCGGKLRNILKFSQSKAYFQSMLNCDLLLQQNK